MNAATLFATLPTTLREELIETYNSISRNYVERRWEPSELNGGKLCEVVYSIIHGTLIGSYAVHASKPSNMLVACQALEQQPQTHPAHRSLRILIPRTLVMLYEVRNNRGVGHVGGEVNPNAMDAQHVFLTASWLVAELVRIFHGVSTDEAQAAVGSITEKKLPFIWKIGNTGRVLAPSMTTPNQILALLYGESGWVNVKDLLNWTEYGNTSRMRGTVLGALHKKRFVEYEAQFDRVTLTPLGIDHVERELLPV